MENALSNRQLKEVLDQVRAALERSHAAGVVHLDLYPGNICIDVHEGRVRATLIDFGVAQFKDEGGGEFGSF